MNVAGLADGLPSTCDSGQAFIGCPAGGLITARAAKGAIFKTLRNQGGTAAYAPSSKKRLLPLVCCAALMMGGCGSTDPAVTTSERQFGAEQHSQLLAQFGGAYEGDEFAYLKRLGNKVAAAADLDGQCTFTLVNTDVVNAFVVPGCYIYVTRGLMSIVNSEAELVSVLAHEVGHGRSLTDARIEVPSSKCPLWP